MKKTSTTSEEARSSQSLILEKLPGHFLVACLLLALGALLWVLKPFLTVIFVAAVLTIAFYTPYLKIVKAFKGRKSLASIVSCLLVIVIIVVPITVFFILMAGEALDTYKTVEEKLDSGVFDNYLKWEDGGFFYDLKERATPVFDLNKIDVKKNIIDVAQNLSTFLVSQTANFLKSISNILLNFVIMLFAMFYFFRDGDVIVKKIGSISPLPSKYESQLFSKIAAMVKAIMIGVFLTAIAQGLVGGIGFAIIGISSPIFWGSIMAFLSLVPLVGTAVIWFPASIILAILGDYWSAIFIFLWGFLLIGTVDNLLRPYLIGGKAHTYPLMTFLVIMGGVWTLGFNGVIVGPLILMVLMSFLHIYESEYTKVLKK